MRLSTVIIRSSLPGISGNGFDISEVTFASCAISGLHTRQRLHTRNNMSRFFFIADAPISYELRVDTLNNSLPVKIVAAYSINRGDPFGHRMPHPDLMRSDDGFRKVQPAM